MLYIFIKINIIKIFTKLLLNFVMMKFGLTEV